MIGGNGRQDPPGFFHFKRVAGIALCVSVAACAGMLAVLMQVTNEQGTGYGQIIGAYSLTGRSLGWSLLIFGLAMVAFAGVTTWLISLYSSFRIAGPLYRFSRNLEMAIEHESALPLPIRHADQLQREWKALDTSLAALRAHYAELRRTLEEIERSLHAGPPGATSPGEAIARLKETERRVRL